MTDKSSVARNMESSICGLVEILSWHLAGRTDENHSNILARITSSSQIYEPDTSALQVYCVIAELTCSVRRDIKTVHENTVHSYKGLARIQTETKIVTETKVRATCVYTILLSKRLTNRLHTSHNYYWNGFPVSGKTSVSKVKEGLLP